jgi:hypothetical protein
VSGADVRKKIKKKHRVDAGVLNQFGSELDPEVDPDEDPTA